MTTPVAAALALATMLLGGCGGGDDPAQGDVTAFGAGDDAAGLTPPGPPVDLRLAPRTFTEARAHVLAATDVTGQGATELRAFVTPSGNIYCSLDLPDRVAGCEIGEGQVEDASACPDNPMTQRVGRLEISGDRAVAVCNTDTIVQPGAVTLAYGTSAFTRDTACVSEQIGVTCISRGADVGFFLARGHYAILGD